MKKGIKILIGITLLFLVMGIVCATDVNNLKMPDKWESIGSGNYHEIGDSPGAGSGRNMMIMDYTNANCDDFFKNGTEDYFIFKNADGSYNFTDAGNDDYGCFEVVNIDGKDYFVWFSTNINFEFDKNTKTIYELMLEFNKLNNLKPVEV